jgi:hypothetical protein
MTASSLSQPKPLWKKALAFTSSDSPIQRSNPAREPSLVEMMSLSDWCRFVPESVGLLVVILVIRAVLPAGSLGSMPHPFWIPVLLMSSQYGIMGGLFATLAATASFFVSGLPVQSATQDFYAYAGIVAAQPCAWFGTALILGGLRSLHIHHQTELQERLDQTGLAAEDLADGLERAISEIERLEQRIAGDSSTLASFLHSLAKIELSDRASLLASIADTIRYGVGATSFAIYLKGANGLEPCLGVEDGSRVKPAAIAPLAPPLLQQIRCGGGATGAAPAMMGSDCLARTPPWALIRGAGVTDSVGIVVCHRLQPSQDPAVAVRRLKEVCDVLAVFLSACPETVSGASRYGGT